MGCMSHVYPTPTNHPAEATHSKLHHSCPETSPEVRKMIYLIIGPENFELTKSHFCMKSVKERETEMDSGLKKLPQFLFFYKLIFDQF